MKKDFVKGIAVGCALSMAIGGASALADTYRKFLEVAYTDIKVVVNGKPKHRVTVTAPLLSRLSPAARPICP